MNKRAIMIGAVGGMTIGAAVPMAWGDYNTLGLTSVFLSMIGGFMGIALAVWLTNKFGF